MDNQEKISKINAELARLELEMELDHGGTDEQDSLGYKFSDWFSFSKSAVNPTDVAPDTAFFETLVLGDVLIYNSIIKEISELPKLKQDLTAMPFSGRLDKKKDNPHAAWSFVYNKVPIFVFFWAGSASSFSVYEDRTPGTVFNFSTMSVSQVWKNRDKIANKKYGYVKGHLHADILVASGSLPYNK
jgi:hypothetical protein